MATLQSRSGRLCDAGRHSMDPNWEKCPYCDAEKRAQKRTQVSILSPVANASDRRKTRVGDANERTRRETKAMPFGASSAGVGGQIGEGDHRRIMGILITYTWQPEGQLFAIREGKNFIGAGSVSSEATHRQCDILINNDPRLSAEHALILCRHGRYDIVDQRSSNGTFLNDELVPLQGTDLPNYAEIKTGSTLWTFIKIEAPNISDSAPPPSTQTDDQPEPVKPKRKETLVR